MTDAWLFRLQVFFDTRVRESASCDDELAINGYKAAGKTAHTTRRFSKRLLKEK
jgi:hypothetical protein